MGLFSPPIPLPATCEHGRTYLLSLAFCSLFFPPFPTLPELLSPPADGIFVSPPSFCLQTLLFVGLFDGTGTQGVPGITSSGAKPFDPR